MNNSPSEDLIFYLIASDEPAVLINIENTDVYFDPESEECCYDFEMDCPQEYSWVTGLAYRINNDEPVTIDSENVSDGKIKITLKTSIADYGPGSEPENFQVMLGRVKNGVFSNYLFVPSGYFAETDNEEGTYFDIHLRNGEIRNATESNYLQGTFNFTRNSDEGQDWKMFFPYLDIETNKLSLRYASTEATLYYSLSDDCGETWNAPEEIIEKSNGYYHSTLNFNEGSGGIWIKFGKNENNSFIPDSFMEKSSFHNPNDGDYLKITFRYPYH